VIPTRKRAKTLKPVRPNVGIELEYRRKIDALVQEMAASYEYWIRAGYRANDPAVAQLAQDASPAQELQRLLKVLAARWQKRFAEAAPKLADWFALSVNRRSDAALRKILKDGGFSVQFKMTRAQRDIINATVNQNVALIKSIPAQYHTQIEGMVMRSVQTGRDLSTLTKELQTHYGVTRGRASFISRDQNSKATSALNRSRQLELGLTKAQWVHSAGGNEPRPTHVKAGRDKVEYDVRKGWFDPDANGKGKGAHIWPGMLINCKCVSRTIIRGMEAYEV
jgi:uncharacterized protein with gpF-like domain